VFRQILFHRLSSNPWRSHSIRLPDFFTAACRSGLTRKWMWCQGGGTAVVRIMKGNHLLRLCSRADNAWLTNPAVSLGLSMFRGNASPGGGAATTDYNRQLCHWRVVYRGQPHLPNFMVAEILATNGYSTSGCALRWSATPCRIRRSPSHPIPTAAIGPDPRKTTHMNICELYNRGDWSIGLHDQLHRCALRRRSPETGAFHNIQHLRRHRHRVLTD